MFAGEPPSLDMALDYWRVRGNLAGQRPEAVRQLQQLDSQYPGNAGLRQTLASWLFSEGRAGSDLGKPATPAILWLADGASETDAYAHGEVMADSNKIIDSLARWFPGVASSAVLSAPPANSFAGGHDKLNAIMMAWFGILMTVPVTDEDKKSSEHQEKRAAAIEKVLEILSPIEAALDGGNATPPSWPRRPTPTTASRR